jgi:hypothetical protein
VRVLNLWQKNNVFKSEIIQPLLDMAAGIPPPVVTPVLASTTAAMSNTPGTCLLYRLVGDSSYTAYPMFTRYRAEEFVQC